MGIYAETTAEITCRSEEDAKKLFFKLIEMKEGDKIGNFWFIKIEVEDKQIYFELNSGRIQNLEWQCEEIWEVAKKNGGVEISCPFLSEADGFYQELETV